MPDKRTHAGRLNATSGETYPPPLTDGHELPPLPHIEDRIADGHMTERARTVAICAAILFAKNTTLYTASAAKDAFDLVMRAEEMDRHERFQKH